MASPAANHLGAWAIAVPVVGALIIGFMARFGSERIRGHGIPEAIEAILINGSKVEPKVAILKPLSSAISIGSGGPFGAEGPIIMTGGAFGSMIAQLFRLSSTERKTLLVAGAAAGMSATFAAPVAAVLLAVELLLFEWKPRSLIPVALASVTAGAMRRYLLGVGPLFPVPAHPVFIGPQGLISRRIAGGRVISAADHGGVCGGGSVSAVADPLDVVARAWGAGDRTRRVDLSASIGRGLRHHRSALTRRCPSERNRRYFTGEIGDLGDIARVWDLRRRIGAASDDGGRHGRNRSDVPAARGRRILAAGEYGRNSGRHHAFALHGVIFALELTHDVNMLLPLLLAVTIAHGFTVLTLRRSILTEKVARRGFHMSREYSVDPLEILFVREVMRSNIIAFDENTRCEDISPAINLGHERRGQLLYPLVDKNRLLKGVVTRNDLHQVGQSGCSGELGKIGKKDPVVAYSGEPLRAVVYRMAETGFTRLPVIESEESGKLAGMISLHDLLRARTRSLEEDRRRERLLRVRLPFASQGAAVADSQT
jgi:CIC family chloride channel protein